MNRSIIMLLALLAAGLAAPASHADISVPNGAQLDLGGGSLDAGATSVLLGGQLSLGSGSLHNLADFHVAPGALAQLDSGTVRLAGDWSNAGSIVPGSSLVAFEDGAAGSIISGETSFASVDFVTSNGKHYAFQAGATQTVHLALTIQGDAGHPIQFESTTAGQAAFIDLLASGSQNISHVGVSDVHATGQHLAPNLQNEGGTGNDRGWFGAGAGPDPSAPPATPVPGLSDLAAGLLGLLLVWLGWAEGRRRRPDTATQHHTIDTGVGS